MLKLFKKVFSMDSSDVEYDMLDLLAWNMKQLEAKLSDAKTDSEKNKILIEYIKRVDQEFKEINDFNEGRNHVLLMHATCASVC